MAINQVVVPKYEQSDGLGTISTVLSIIPQTRAVGAALGAVNKVSQANNTNIDTSNNGSPFQNGAMGRRKEMMAVDHGTELKSAISAIDSSDWDMERKKQLRAPIEQALYKGGYV